MDFCGYNSYERENIITKEEYEHPLYMILSFISSLFDNFKYQYRRFSTVVVRLSRKEKVTGSIPVAAFLLYMLRKNMNTIKMPKKWSHPDSNWGHENQNLGCCPYTMRPYTSQNTNDYMNLLSVHTINNFLFCFSILYLCLF